MSDWSRYASGSGTTSGGGWSRYGGGGGTVVASGGGGGGGGGGLLGLVENLGSDIGSTITNAPRGVISLAHQAAHTFGPSGVTENIFSKNPTGVHWLDQILNAGRNEHKKNFAQDTAGLGGGALVPFVKQERHIYGSALHGNFHPLYQHPLQPLLDIATVATGGGALAAKAAEAGRLGETLGNVARAERVLKTEKLEAPLNVSRTLQGRYLQQRFDRFSMENPDMRIVGANPRLAKITDIRNYRATIRAGMPAREFQQATKGLTRDEKFAFHVAAEDAPLHERIDFYRKEFRDNPTPQLRDYLHRLESDGVHQALTEPSQKFIDALHEGHALQKTATQRLVDAGELTPETHEARTALPRDVLAPNSAVPAFESGSHIHEAFPPAFRFPHIGEEAGKPGLFTTPSNASALRPPKTPGFLKRSEAVRLRAARLMTDPEVLTRDYLATMRHEHLNEMYHKVIRPVSKKIDPTLERTGFKKPEEFYTFEKTSQRAPRTVTQQEAMSRDLGMVDAKGHETPLGAKSRVFSGAEDAPTHEIADAIRNHDYEKLDQMGVRRVPAAFAKRYNANFASTGKMMRLFWDKPLDVWRAMTLNLRPAWMVNNLVGNAAQYALRYAGVNGAEAYLRALLATERGEAKVLQIRNYTMRIPTLRRKYGRIFGELFPEVHGTGLYSTHMAQTRGGVYQSTIDAAAATKAARALSVPAKTVKTILTAIPKGITAFERHFAEAVPREAAMMNELRPVIQKLGLANQSWEDALRAIAEGDIKNGTRHGELATDRMLDYMGDFNAMNATERRVIKRIIPFESWYRVILQVSGKFLLHYPGRVNLIRAIGESYQADNKDLPSWLKGAIPVGPEIGGVQPMLTTMGLNPYETIPQLAQQNPAGSLAFGLQGLATGVTGVDPFTQGAYRGIGASKGYDPLSVLKRTAGATFEGLVPTRLYQQTVGKPPAYLYQPKTYGHVGPVAINDAMLQYLGLPIRHVRKGVAKTYAQEGR